MLNLPNLSNVLKMLCFILVVLAADVSQAPAQNFEQVAEDVSTGHNKAIAKKQKQDKKIEGKQQDLQQKIAELNKTLTKEEGLLITDRDSLNLVVNERNKIKQEISTRLASKEELDNIFLDHIRNFLALAETAPYSAQHPERLTKLKSYLGTEKLFDLTDMTTLFIMYFADIVAGGKNINYQGTILERSGEEIDADIIRLGHVGAIYQTENKIGFLTLSSGSNRLLMSGDPGYFVRQQLRTFFAGEELETPIDITGGAAISQLSRKETLKDRLKSGGLLVIPILFVALVAIFLTIERVAFLSKVRTNTDQLMSNVTELVLKGKFAEALDTTRPHQNRPTGKVLMAGLVARGENEEVIESAISEAILTQAPRLERFIRTLKVLAAVAPLLGLLGTVTGMINTFQVITIHGTGDPRLMAGGISEAMITTQVGLAVAIPILMIASFLGGRVRNLAQDMEEKGIALMGALLKHKSSL